VQSRYTSDAYDVADNNNSPTLIKNVKKGSCQTTKVTYRIAE
jgi:hypothetical protein